MDFFHDFSLYQYYHYENAINIGFCTSENREPTQADEVFFQKLVAYLDYPFNPTRGGDWKSVTLSGREYWLGLAEMRVLAKSGKVYAAPNIIVSNIMDGTYVPPSQFIEAVVNGVPPESDAYRQYTERYDEAHLWGATDEYIKLVDSACSIIRGGDLPGLKAFLETADQDLLVTRNGSLINEAILAGREGLAAYLIECDREINRFDGVELLSAIDCDMERIVDMLLDRQIVIKTDLPRNNPLFWAIAKHKNPIAQRLYEEKRELVLIYETEYTRDCNILKWAKMFGNESFIDYIQNRY